LEKLESQGVKIDTETHSGRQAIGYNYLDLVGEENETE